MRRREPGDRGPAAAAPSPSPRFRVERRAVLAGGSALIVGQLTGCGPRATPVAAVPPWAAPYRVLAAPTGVHDCGGKLRGPIRYEPGGASEPWERQMQAIIFDFFSVAIDGIGVPDPIQYSRMVRARIAPEDYLRARYFEMWECAVGQMLHELGLVSHAEVEARVALLIRSPERPAPSPAKLKWGAADFPGWMVEFFSRTPHPHGPVPVRPPPGKPPRFRVGDAVTVVRETHPGHDSLPGYVRGKRGRIDKVYGYGVQVPDLDLAGNPILGREPVITACYSVAFTSAELWGAAAEANVTLRADLLDLYLT